MLGVGCVILLWHSLGLPYNYFEKNKTKYPLLQKVMNGYKDTVCMSFDELLERVAKMEFEE